MANRMKVPIGFGWLFWSVITLAQAMCTPANVTPVQLTALRAEITLQEVSGVMGCTGEPSSLPVPVLYGIGQTWSWSSLYPAPWQITVAFRNGRALAATGVWVRDQPIIRFGAEFGNPEFLSQ